MRSHLLLMVGFAFFVSVVFAAIAHDDLSGQLRFAGKLFAGFIAAAFILGWLMYPFPM